MFFFFFCIIPGQIFKAHKLILAACSKNFAELFETAPAGANGSICVILEATSAENMQALLEFMYKGEVHVSQKALESFLKAAESLQVKGLTAEHNRFTNPSSSSSTNVPSAHPPPSSPQCHDVSPMSRRQSHQTRGNMSSLDSYAKSVKRETDMIMHSSPASLTSYQPYLTPYLPQMNFEPPRKRHQKSPFMDQDSSPRGSVLRDGSKGMGLNSPSPVGGKSGYGGGRPSSVSSNAPTEADTQQMERNSPQQSK